MGLRFEKEAKVAEIKDEAAVRIRALDWKVERGEERKALTGNDESLIAAYTEREEIRVASSAAEVEVMALTTVEGVRAYQW